MLHNYYLFFNFLGKIIIEIQYLGLFIFSIFLYINEIKQKGGSIIPINFGNSENKSFSSKKTEKNLLEVKYISLSDLMVIVLLYFCNQFFFHFSLFQLKGLDYWMFEILFIALVFSKLYNLPIYKHKKFAIFLVLFFVLYLKYYQLYGDLLMIIIQKYILDIK